MLRRLVLSLVLLAGAAAPALAADAPAQAAAGVPGPTPQLLMDQVSQSLLRELDADRAAYRKDPAKLRALVDKYLLPNFDTDFSARRVLGRHWTTATPGPATRSG